MPRPIPLAGQRPLTGAIVIRVLAAGSIAILSSAAPAAPAAHAAEPASSALSVPADSPRWSLEGQASVVQRLGRQCILLDGGAATLNDFELRDGVLDVDLETSAARGFFGFQFRITPDGE